MENDKTIINNTNIILSKLINKNKELNSSMIINASKLENNNYLVSTMNNFSYKEVMDDVYRMFDDIDLNLIDVDILKKLKFNNNILTTCLKLTIVSIEMDELYRPKIYSFEDLINIYYFCRNTVNEFKSDFYNIYPSLKLHTIEKLNMLINSLKFTKNNEIKIIDVILFIRIIE